MDRIFAGEIHTIMEALPLYSPTRPTRPPGPVQTSSLRKAGSWPSTTGLSGFCFVFEPYPKWNSFQYTLNNLSYTRHNKLQLVVINLYSIARHIPRG